MLDAVDDRARGALRVAHEQHLDVEAGVDERLGLAPHGRLVHVGLADDADARRRRRPAQTAPPAGRGAAHGASPSASARGTRTGAGARCPRAPTRIEEVVQPVRGEVPRVLALHRGRGRPTPALAEARVLEQADDRGRERVGAVGDEQVLAVARRARPRSRASSTPSACPSRGPRATLSRVPPPIRIGHRDDRRPLEVRPHVGHLAGDGDARRGAGAGCPRGAPRPTMVSRAPGERRWTRGQISSTRW